MDLINRYIYAVTKSLPEKQRADIELELRTLIDDMIEELDDGLDYEGKVRHVLEELGDPTLLAQNYRGGKRYLIGPGYYDRYLLTIKVVLPCVFLGISIAFFFSTAFGNEVVGANIVGEYLASVISALTQAAAWITIGYVIAERNFKDEAPEQSKWDISKLPELPKQKAKIRIADPIAGILFTTIFWIFMLSVPQYFAAYIGRGDELHIISVFNTTVLKEFSIVMIGIFICGIIKEGLQLFYGRWTFKLALACSTLSIISMVLALFMFTSNIWNVNFMDDIIRYTNTNIQSSYINIKNILIAIIIFGTSIDVVSTMFKGIRASTGRGIEL